MNSSKSIYHRADGIKALGTGGTQEKNSREGQRGKDGTWGAKKRRNLKRKLGSLRSREKLRQQGLEERKRTAH